MPFSPLLLLILAAPGQAPADAPAPRTDYYLSEARILGPDGKARGAMVALSRREYLPTEGRIEQMDIALDPAPDSLPTVVVYEWTVTGATAEVRDHSGRVKGQAKLVGAPWAWTEWSWTGTMKDIPGTFRNATRVTRRGLATRTERSDTAGKRLEIYDQIDTKITKETYDVLRTRLLPQ